MRDAACDAQTPPIFNRLKGDLVVDGSIAFSGDDQSIAGQLRRRADLSAIARLLDLFTPIGLEPDLPCV